MNRFKSAALHIFLFILAVTLLWLLLVLSTCIPNSAILGNMHTSALSYKNADAFSFADSGRLKTVGDNYADAILLGVSLNMGEGNPFAASLDTKYYDGESYGENAGLYLTTAGKAEPNTDYTRYWHGSAMLLRLLHLFLNVGQIKLAGLFSVLLLAASCVFMLWRRGHADLAICLVLALAAVDIWNIRLSLEYQPCFVICFIMCILFLHFERKSDSFLTYLSVIGGATTAFFDFLTTETTVLLLPLILTVAVRAKEKRLGDFKSMFILLMQCVICWLLAYGGTFVYKWIAASIATGSNKIATAFTSAEVRMFSSAESQGIHSTALQIVAAPFANLTVLFGGRERLEIARAVIGLILSVMLIVSAVYLCKNTTPDKTAVMLLGMLSAVVLARYMLLSNHSYLHEFFTYRALICPIMAAFAAVALCRALHKKEDRRK